MIYKIKKFRYNMSIKMNLVGIDPSLISTGLTINGKVFNFTREKDIWGKTKMKKWYKMGEPVIKYETVVHNDKTDDYSQNEIIKMIDYDKITTDIVEKIKEEIDHSLPTRIGIESYSYNSKNGDIIDLVTFSTTLRIKLYQQVTRDLKIISPASLKLEAAKLTYEPIVTGKRVLKYTYRNNDGIAGGHFQKREMLLALVDNDNFNDEYVEYLRENKDEIIGTGIINKPFEDCNDSFILYKWLESNI